MIALVRVAVLAAIVGLVIFVLWKALQLRQSGEGRRIIPFCSKCESNRYVAANAGTDPRYPERRYAWYCQRCQEGF
ncbi:MAG: hypothetical protein HYY00_02195 [Chloroflexi bacterium]|nr:hypothetical protein [Chloroflexota bacterium]